MLTALEIYGRPIKGWDWFIACTNPSCLAFVETRPGTYKAIATMATPQTRRARRMAHSVFDQIWQPDRSKRKEAYIWLSRMMGLSERECHILRFNVEQCSQVIRLVNKYYPIRED